MNASTEHAHEPLMHAALDLARQAALLDEVPVGCLIVRNGVVVGRGFNRRETSRNALAHAEILAIDEACRMLGGWRLPGCDLYVTLEPCPMCAGAIINARIARVFFGARDPNAGALVSRTALFSLGFNHTPDIHEGLLAEESAALLKSFFAAKRG